MTDWLDLLPSDVARDQDAFERRMRIYRMHRDAGMRQKDIARILGVSPGRIHTMLGQAKYHISHGLMSPYERYCASGHLNDEERRAAKAVVLAPPVRVRLGPPAPPPTAPRQIWRQPKVREIARPQSQAPMPFNAQAFLAFEICRLVG